MKVLVVDDEPACTQFLSMALEMEGFEVKSCTKAEEAWMLAQSFKPNFLITDWMLKDSEDGIDLARKISRSVPEVKTVFITGMAKELLIEQLKDVAYHSILVKPLDLNEIVGMLRAS